MTTPTSFPASVPYLGHRCPSRPYSLVIRDGTRGKPRETLEMILRAVAPFTTKDEAVQAKGRVREDLRPFVSISRYTGMVQR